MELSLWVSLTTLIVTVVYYYKMVVLTELTTEASLFNTLYAEYATPQMMDALRAVEEFTVANQLTEDEIICRDSTTTLWTRSLDHDWQRLHHWYRKVVYFHRMGLLHERFFVEFPGKTRARQFIDHVEPFSLNSCRLYKENNCSDTFDYLRSLYKIPAREPASCMAEQSRPSDKDEL